MWRRLSGRFVVAGGRGAAIAPGLWNGGARAEQGWSAVRQAESRSHQHRIFSFFGVSAFLFWGGAQKIETEENCHTTPPTSVASALNQATDAYGYEGGIQESSASEVASNVHTAKWRVFTDMGRDLFSKGRLDEAEKYLVQALEEAKQGFGERDPHVASSCNNLAELYRMKREYGKAVPLFLEAVDGLEKAFNPDHVSVSFTLHNLAGTYLLERKFEQARFCYERSLKIKEKNLGPNHPEYANTMFHLGEVLRLQGKFADAEKLIRDSIDILQEGGAGHSQLAIRQMGRLVEILSQTSQLREAEQLQRKILHNLELSQGLESSNSTTAAENLAGTLQAVGKLEEAEELLQRCFEVRQKLLPPTHIQLGVTMFKLASVSMQRGEELASKKNKDDTAHAKVEYERAEQLLNRAIRIAERSWKPVAGVQGAAALRAGPLISLLRSLDALGRLEIQKMGLASSPEEVESGAREAETLFRHCLSLLNKPGVSEDLASVPEFQRQHIACLRHLAELLSSTPSPETKSDKKHEIDQLLKILASIEAELRKKGSV